MGDLVEHFSLERVNKAAAGFDAKKLQAFQERHMRDLAADAKVKMVMPFLQRAEYVPSPASGEDEARVEAVVAAAGERIKVAGDVLDFDEFFTADEELEFEEKAFEKRLRKPDEAAGLLSEFKEKLAAAEAFDADGLDKLLHDFVEEQGIKIGQIIHALRVAVTGKGVGVGMFEAMALLGKESCLARIGRALSRL